MIHDEGRKYFETYEEQIKVLNNRISRLDKSICKMLSERDDSVHEKGFIEGKISEYKSRIR